MLRAALLLLLAASAAAARATRVGPEVVVGVHALADTNTTDSDVPLAEVQVWAADNDTDVPLADFEIWTSVVDKDAAADSGAVNPEAAPGA